MAQQIKGPWSLVIPSAQFQKLHAHVFPGDNDEHGAVIGASMVSTPTGITLLARKVFLATDGIDYVDGTYGYKKLTADFVHTCIDYCAKNRLVYIAVHCHGGDDEVSFSPTDIQSHERTYPALLDIVGDLPVAGLVLAHNAAAGDIWLPDRTRCALQNITVPAYPNIRLYPAPSKVKSALEYPRQALIFGDKGQALLSQQTVGIIGAGGVGSLLVEYLSRLGVGKIIIADPEKVAPSNLPRMAGGRKRDVCWMKHDSTMKFIPRFLVSDKVAIAKRVAKQAHPRITIEAIAKDISYSEVAEKFKDCDHIFLAADSMQAKHVFNALVNQYLITGTQVGVKVSVNPKKKQVTDIYSVTRVFVPGEGCMWCNELIDPHTLNEEAKTSTQRKQQRYIDDENVHAPSVITLNAVAASHAVDDYLFSLTGMLESKPEYPFSYYQPLESSHKLKVWYEKPRKNSSCTECGENGWLASGDSRRLPVRWDGAK